MERHTLQNKQYQSIVDDDLGMCAYVFYLCIG